MLFYESPKTGLHASKVKKHFSFLKTIYLIWPNFEMIRKRLVRSSSKIQSR